MPALRSLQPALIPQWSPAAETGYPVGPGNRNPRHGGGLYRECDEILRLQIMHVRLAACARDRLRLEGEHAQIVGELAARHDRIEPAREVFVLRGDARWIAPLVPIVVSAGGGAEQAVFVLEMRIVVADGKQRCG